MICCFFCACFTFSGKTLVYLHAGNGGPCLLGTNVIQPVRLMKADSGVERRPVEDRNQGPYCGSELYPSRCGVAVEVTVQGQLIPDQFVPFTPEVNWMAKTSLQLEDEMVAPGYY